MFVQINPYFSTTSNTSLILRLCLKEVCSHKATKTTVTERCKPAKLMPAYISMWPYSKCSKWHICSHVLVVSIETYYMFIFQQYETVILFRKIKETIQILVTTDVYKISKQT